MEIKELIDDFLSEATADYVGLWEIAQVVREELRASTADEVRNMSMTIVKQLYKRGLRPGDYYLGSRFDFWPDEGLEAMLDRIEREWIRNGADPNLAEPICWFAPRPR